MGYCHLAGIIHRDVTPSNVLFHNGVLKMTDFGISKQLNSRVETSTINQQWTLKYQSPERIMNKRYGTKADIWSFGCIMYELCMLKHPFTDFNMNLVLENKIKEGIFEPLPDRFSNEMKELVNACLSVNPDDRPDAVTILNRIKEIQQE